MKNKLRYAFLILLCSMCTIQPTQATQTKNILITSKQLPYILYIQILDTTHMHVHFISRDMRIPCTCRTHSTALKQLDLTKDASCVQKSVETFFHIKITNHVYLHLNRIAKDLHVPYTHTNFENLQDTCDYFAKILAHSTFSTILHYKNYIQSDFHIKDYYDFYHMFKNKKVNITYYYVNQLVMDTYTLPMDHTFKKKS